MLMGVAAVLATAGLAMAEGPRDRRGGDHGRGGHHGSGHHGGHGHGGVSVGIGIQFGSGRGHRDANWCPPTTIKHRRPVVFDDCRPSFHSHRVISNHVHHYRRPVYVAPCPPVVVRRPIIIERCDPIVVERPIIIERPVYQQPQVIYTTPAPAPQVTEVQYVSQEEWSWRALASGSPEAMEKFGDLMSRSEARGAAELGYAICAAAAGQVERADWAASQALQYDAEVARKVPNIPGLKEQIVSALKNYELLATDRTPQRAQTIALLKAAAGDLEGSDRAMAAAQELRALAAARQANAAPTQLAVK
jgi:hypothetical protein